MPPPSHLNMAGTNSPVEEGTEFGSSLVPLPEMNLAFWRAVQTCRVVMTRLSHVGSTPTPICIGLEVAWSDFGSLGTGSWTDWITSC